MMNPTLESAWNGLSDKLRRFIRSRVSDDATAEDILQDTFLRLSEHLAKKVEPDSVSGWLHLVARRAVVDHYRSRKDVSELSDKLPAEETPSTEEEGLHAAFRRMVEALPEPFREAIILTEFEGLTQAELASRLEISLSGAKSRVQRGRDQLRTMLDECCHFDRDHRGRVIGAEPKKRGNCPECDS
jgi:RNA polymerase sigma-70 factor, ECF subfamily